MDKNVIPLVEYFNSQGLITEMSCQGHNRTNKSMFWISFTDSIKEQDIINFQMKHRDKMFNFTSCGRFAERLFVGQKAIVKKWYYFAATVDAAMADLQKWKNDNI